MLDKVRKIFPNIDNFNIFEGVIDPETQVEYFEYVINNRKKIDEEEIVKNKDKIFEPDTSIEEKKKLIANLAKIAEVEVYRTLEKYSKNPDEELKNWIVIALQENKAFLKSTLLEEKHIFISTGLGGSGSCLRYFIVLITREQKELLEIQKKIIKSELKFYLNNNESKFEKVEFGKYFATVLTLIPLKISVQKIFNKIIKEINQIGDFMSEDYIISNVKSHSVSETDELISRIIKEAKNNKFEKRLD